MAKEKNKLKISKKKVVIVIAIIIILLAIFAIARYVLDRYKDFYTRTEEFYFGSDRLDENMPVYQLENWSGADPYLITINLNNGKNNLEYTSYDIGYNILTPVCSENAVCSVSKTSGIIYTSPDSISTDSFTLMVTPNTNLQTGDIVWVELTVEADSKYEKTLNARFNLVIGKENIAYEIIDSENSPYLELSITNTLSYYTVSEAFGSYSVNARIPREDYMELSEVNKEKCYSALIGVNFSPNTVLLDMTDENFLRAITNTTTIKNGYNYINSISFKVEAITSTRVRFYKIDPSGNYSYPNGSGAFPVLTVNMT